MTTRANFAPDSMTRIGMMPVPQPFEVEDPHLYGRDHGQGHGDLEVGQRGRVAGMHRLLRASRVCCVKLVSSHRSEPFEDPEKIDDRENDDPHDVDEVPVERRQIDVEVALRSYPASLE